MPKFRKIPIVIEAVQLTWENWSEICEFAGVGKLSDGKPEGCYVGPGENEVAIKHMKTTSNYGSETDEIGLRIPTLEGLHLGRQNDWIIKGVNGELYPCKPDIFRKTYESAEPEVEGETR